MFRTILFILSNGFGWGDNMRPTGSAFYNFYNSTMDKYFAKSEYVNINIKSLNYCQKEKGLLVYVYCKKSNNLRDTIGILKNFPREKFTSNRGK